MLKVIAVQITGLSNVGHDTGLMAVFGPKTRLKKKRKEKKQKKKKKKKKKTFMGLWSVFVSFSIRFVSFSFSLTK